MTRPGRGGAAAGGAPVGDAAGPIPDAGVAPPGTNSTDRIGRRRPSRKTSNWSAFNPWIGAPSRATTCVSISTTSVEPRNVGRCCAETAATPSTTMPAAIVLMMDRERGLYRPARVRLSVSCGLNLFDDAGRGPAGLDRNSHHFPAARFDRLAADDGIGGPVGAFDEHVRLNLENDLGRRFLVEDDGRIDALERGEDLRPLALRGDRPLRSFVRA